MGTQHSSAEDLDYTIVPINPDFKPVLAEHRLRSREAKKTFEKHCEVRGSYAGYCAGIEYKVETYQVNHEKFSERNGAPLLLALFQAYAEHGDVYLTPDDIWQHCLGELGTWVNDYPEYYRSVITDAKEGKKVVAVGVDRFPSTEQAWCETLAQFTRELRKQAEPAVGALLDPTFSTTSPLDVAVNSVLVMHTVKEFFDFRLKLSCGIRHLHLGGTIADWEALERAAETLKPFGLARWVDEKLRPILHQFTRARRGDVDVAWWNRIFRQDAQRIGIKKLGYGRGTQGSYNYVTGWVLGFSPQFLDVDPATSQVKLRDFKNSLRTISMAVDVCGVEVGILKVIGGLLGFTRTDRGYAVVKGVAVLSPIKQVPSCAAADDTVE